jgi:hypothetical protein
MDKLRSQRLGSGLRARTAPEGWTWQKPGGSLTHDPRVADKLTCLRGRLRFYDRSAVPDRAAFGGLSQ